MKFDIWLAIAVTVYVLNMGGWIIFFLWKGFHS